MVRYDLHDIKPSTVHVADWDEDISRYWGPSFMIPGNIYYTCDPRPQGV
jgi:hypothetical protein